MKSVVWCYLESDTVDSRGVIVVLAPNGIFVASLSFSSLYEVFVRVTRRGWFMARVALAARRRGVEESVASCDLLIDCPGRDD